MIALGEVGLVSTKPGMIALGEVVLVSTKPGMIALGEVGYTLRLEVDR